jgi:hypothetical protein
MDSYSKLLKNCKEMLNFFEISQIITGKTPTKANLKKRQVYSGKTKVNSPIVFANFIKRTKLHQTLSNHS